MQPPILPIQYSDAQWAVYSATVQSTTVTPTTVAPTTSKPDTTTLMNAIVVLFLLGAFGAIVHKRRQTQRLHQSIHRLEKLWKLESHSPFEERF